VNQDAFDRWAAARRLPPGIQLERPRNILPYLRRYVWRPLRKRMVDSAYWLLGEYQNGIDQARNVRLFEVLIPVPGLDSRLNGLSILHLSDLHLGTLDGVHAAIEEAVSGLSVDLCLLTGDYAPSYRARPDRVLERMRSILNGVIAPHGTFAILGNYDSAALARALAASGMCRLLINETVTVPVNGCPISITGTDDPYEQPHGAILSALARPSEGFRIAMVHSPDLAAEAATSGHHLYLCGHTHGGQICRPSGRPILTNCRRRRDLASGLWREGSMWGYTSRGAGVSGIPRRHYCPPEVTLLRLVAGYPIEG
jgi:uncharacterized protein